MGRGGISPTSTDSPTDSFSVMANYYSWRYLSMWRSKRIPSCLGFSDVHQDRTAAHVKGDGERALTNDSNVVQVFASIQRLLK